MSRSKYKGPFFKVNLLKKKQWIKIDNKNLTILPEYVDHFVNIYNGKTFINIKINEKMIGFKFGEFVNTKNIAKVNVLTQTKVDIVAKDGEVAEGHETTRYSTIDSCDTLVTCQLKSGRIEYLLAGTIQFGKPFD